MIDHWLAAVPPVALYVTVFLVVGVESLGIPLPGEIVLITAALLASRFDEVLAPTLDETERGALYDRLARNVRAELRGIFPIFFL